MTSPGPGLDHLPDEAYQDPDDIDPRYARRDSDPDFDDERKSPLIMLTLYLFLPALVASTFVLWGMHLGAQNPEAWYTRFIVWLTS